MSADLKPPKPGEFERDVEEAVRRHARPHFRTHKHDDTAPGSIARRIVDHLRVANWRHFRGPLAKPHSTRSHNEGE